MLHNAWVASNPDCTWTLTPREFVKQTRSVQALPTFLVGKPINQRLGI